MLSTIWIALSMYSKIPVPSVKWTKEKSRYVICFFPLVGLVIGLLETVWIWACMNWQIEPEVEALVGVAIPIIVTGGIHMDGFVDTEDALHSYANPQKKLEILKDPHIGAFAIIRVILYALLCVAASISLCYGQMDWKAEAWLVTLIVTFCRVLSGVAVVTFPCAKREGTLYQFSGEGVKHAVRFIMHVEMVLLMIGLVWRLGIMGGAVILANLLFFVYYRLMSKKEFLGITGDLAGWYLCNAELLSLGVAAVVQILS